MKLLQLAIAAVVDANTEAGLARNLKRFHDAADAEERARKLRARQSVGTASKLGHWVHARLERYRQQAAYRRELRQLLQLDDRLLKDVGLTRGDLVSVQLGATTLEELNAQRESRRRVRSLDPVSSLNDGQPVGWVKAPDAAAAAAAKCA